MRVAVIGAGFWGVACALALTERGAEVDVYDDGGTGASRAAAGIVQKAWYRARTLTATRLPAWWDDEYAKAGWALLNERCGLDRVGEWFGTPANPELRHRSDLYMIESPNTLLDLWKPIPEEILRVQSFNDRAVHIVARHKRVSYEAVVIAAGVRTDDLLACSGLPPVGVVGLRGRAYLTDRGPADGIPHTWLSAPYKHLTWRPWAGRTAGRLGDTVERGPLRPSTSRWDLYAREALTRFDPGASITGTVSGVRPVLPVIMAERVTAGVWVATGGHRVGLALAGGIAARITQEVFDGRS